jgi:hypothetical protein
MSDLDIVKRENVIEKLAQKRTDDVDTQTLMEMFQENQICYLENMSDNELLEHLEDYEEFDLLKEIK